MTVDFPLTKKFDVKDEVTITAESECRELRCRDGVMMVCFSIQIHAGHAKGVLVIIILCSVPDNCQE